MSNDVRKPTFLFQTRSDTNRAVQRKKMGRALKFWIKKVEGFYYMYPCSKNKGADQLCVTVKLICVFVFAYAKCWFSHDVAHIMISTLSHTAVASKTSMSEYHSVGAWIQGKTDRRECFNYFHRESAADTTSAI